MISTRTRCCATFRALELLLDEEADPAIFDGSGSGNVITEDEDSLPEQDRHEKFERQRLAAIHRLFVQASDVGLTHSVVRRTVASLSPSDKGQSAKDLHCHEPMVEPFGTTLCWACEAKLPCDCEEDAMVVDNTTSLSPPASKVGTHSSSSYLQALSPENILSLEHKSDHSLDRHETVIVDALWQERCDESYHSLADLEEAIRLSLLCPPRDEVMESVDIMVLILHHVYVFGGPACVRPGCPCTSTFSGSPGANCCRTCFDGKPCGSNVHPTPFTPRQVPELPPFVALVCKSWRQAWDITQMEWVMDREYPAALYWLAGVVQRVSTRAVVSAEVIEERLEREAASRAEHTSLDRSPPTSVVVEQLNLENLILLAKIRLEHGSDESIGTDEYIAQLVANEGNLYAAARVYERLITPRKIISPISITLATSILSTHSPDDTADRILAAQVHEATMLDKFICTSSLAQARLANVPHIVLLSDYLIGPDAAEACTHPSWTCICGEYTGYLCVCFTPEPKYCVCRGPISRTSCPGYIGDSTRPHDGRP